MLTKSLQCKIVMQPNQSVQEILEREYLIQNLKWDKLLKKIPDQMLEQAQIFMSQHQDLVLLLWIKSQILLIIKINKKNKYKQQILSLNLHKKKYMRRQSKSRHISMVLSNLMKIKYKNYLNNSKFLITNRIQRKKLNKNLKQFRKTKKILKISKILNNNAIKLIHIRQLLKYQRCLQELRVKKFLVGQLLKMIQKKSVVATSIKNQPIKIIQVQIFLKNKLILSHLTIADVIQMSLYTELLLTKIYILNNQIKLILFYFYFY
ncbi:hypothetical protein TTHERM_001159899 (macronuclear) [Tetrahymena thermophila SB210]|uniref:Uncharacterized protein n=1 Tax=Tetrahymena thermophila (strain SB210) TaxID=312017 RepID=W7XHA3_TETTS|nr:hypothetical protein TTHERM_001159899 [Tetrahymena thermophila SB210]EWS73731.1 hypothetical protein TTHERM_001159899 [Tetrahymena thermophila SB210]|eukprot:XP_012653769.1 hypothetical protein TTHERM_001159899 [Tetrahymena thermophila SB210]